MARKGFWKLALVCFLVLALALTVGACKKKEEPKTQPTPGQTEQPKKEEPKKEEPKKEAPKEPLKIGYMGPITGNWSAYGTNHLNAAILAADEWNKKGGLLGRQIEIVQADSQADPQQAAVLANKLVDQKVAAVIGPTFSLEAEVTVPVFKANNMVSVTGLADLMDPKGSEGYFRVSPREDLQAYFGGRMMLDYFKGKKIALIDDGKSDAVRTNEFLAGWLEKKGIKPVYAGSITPAQQNYTPTLSKVKSLEPDVVYLATLNPESALLRKQANEIGLNVPFVITVSNDDPIFAEIAGAAGKNAFTYDTGVVKDKFDAFLAAFKAKFNVDAGYLNEFSYDAANVLFTAITNAKSTDAAAIKAALKALDYQGITGPIKFDDTNSRMLGKFEALKYDENTKTWGPLDVGFDEPN